MRLLYSTRRGPLTTRCLDEVRARAGCNPYSRSIILVPEQSKMDMERAFFADPGNPGLMFTEILSFRRLSWRLLGEVGLAPSSVIDPVGQAMLIHGVLRRNQQNLHSFGHLADKPGFIREVSAVLGDLKRYRIGPDDMRAASVSAQDKGLKNKAHDLSILLEAYDRALQETELADSEDDLNRLADLLQLLERLPSGPWPWPWHKLAWLRETAFWVCGFAELRDFTPQEEAILAALESLSGPVALTVAADQIPFDLLSVDNGSDCFLNGRKTAFRIMQRFPGSRIEKLPDPVGGVAAKIAARIRSTAVSKDGACQPALRLVQANSRDDELAWIASEIRRLVQVEGFRYRDISLALCDLPGYSSRLGAVCRESGIPLFLDTEKPLSGTPLARFVLGLLDISLYGWTRNAVMTCLRAGLAPLLPSEIDRLENEWLARGLFHGGRIFDDRRYSDDVLIKLRNLALEPIREFLGKIGRERTGEGKCHLLEEFLIRADIPDKIRSRSESLVNGQEGESAVALVQSWNEMCRILDQMARLSGSLEISVKTFRDTLAAGMDSASSGVIPTAIDQVSAGSLKRAMLRSCRAMFLIGASASFLPPTLPPEGLLKDQDRQTISAVIKRQLPSNVRDQVFADAYMIYTLLTLPSDRLYMTSPEPDTSAWFNELARMEPDGVLRLPETLSRLGVGPNAAMPASLTEGKVDAGLVQALHGEHIVVSVSQLERYAECPFLHLAANLLMLKEREIWQPQMSETGILMHGIAELAMRELSDELAGPDAADETGRQDILKKWLDSDLSARTLAWMHKAAKLDNLERFFEAGLFASVGRRAQRQVAASVRAIVQQFCKSAYRPAHLEWTFGPTETDSLGLHLAERVSLDFRGKVDRIDFLDDSNGRTFRIIDYKSGDKSIDFDSLFCGLSLQLPVYLAAFGYNHPACQPSDAAYFRFDRPIIRLGDGRRPNPEKLAEILDRSYALHGLGMSPAEINMLCRHTLKQAAVLAKAIFEGNFGVIPRKLPGRQPACEYCPMLSVCGFDKKPSGYHRIEPLRCRPDEAGRPVSKRRELVLRLEEEEHRTGG